MTTIWNLPRLDMLALSEVRETRPTALLTGQTAWQMVSSALKLPLVAQAEPTNVTRAYLDEMAGALPDQTEVIYGVGGGLVADAAKYIAHKRGKPAVIIPTVLSVDGFFTPHVAVREFGTVNYVDSGPAEQVYIDLDLIAAGPQHLRGAAIVELLTIVTGLLDWQYAARMNKNTYETRFIPWAASVMAGIAQQAFKIAQGVGDGKLDALEDLLDLVCVEVQLTNQLGHNRPQEGSEQFFAYALESRISNGQPLQYANIVAPGLLVAMALHKQQVDAIRDTLIAAGVRLGQINTIDAAQTLRGLPNFVRQHNLPYSILNDFDPATTDVNSIIAAAKLV